MKCLLISLSVTTLFMSAAYGQDKPKPDQAQTAPMPRKASPLPPAVGDDYAWDEFNHLGRMVWACRSVQSGAVVLTELCAFKPKVDSQWPDKKVPGDWKE